MTRETLLTLAACIGLFAWLAHVDPIGGVAATVQIAEAW